MVEKEYVDSKELAHMLSVSRKFIERHRNRIVGAQKIGRCWRFNLSEVRKRLAAGRDIIGK